MLVAAIISPLSAYSENFITFDVKLYGMDISDGKTAEIGFDQGLELESSPTLKVSDKSTAEIVIGSEINSTGEAINRFRLRLTPDYQTRSFTGDFHYATDNSESLSMVEGNFDELVAVSVSVNGIMKLAVIKASRAQLTVK